MASSVFRIIGLIVLNVVLFLHLLTLTQIDFGNGEELLLTGTTTKEDRNSGGDAIQALRERVEVLETKIDSFLSFGVDPFLSVSEVPGACHNRSYLWEYCTVRGYGSKDECESSLDLQVCLDEFPFVKKRNRENQNNNNTAEEAIEEKECIVYDFGIRDQPMFGEILSREPFNCKVYAFDPSPVTKEWYYEERHPTENVQRLRKNPNYNFLPYGAGGEDGEITLNEYNWGQVSIYRYPTRVVDPSRCDPHTGKCKYKTFDVQKRFKLPVRSLASIMGELGHDHVTIVKLDVEGSEYRFLEAVINDEETCRSIQQITLEWHHMEHDARYGTASQPHINTFVALLDKRCDLVQYNVYDQDGGWPSNEKIYTDMDVTLRYQLASFVRRKKKKKKEAAAEEK